MYGLTIWLFVFVEGDSCEFGSAKYFALCGFGGVLSCGLTHTAVVPLDLVKCRIQVCWDCILVCIIINELKLIPERCYNCFDISPILHRSPPHRLDMWTVP